MWPCVRKKNPYLKTIDGLLLTDFQKQILRDRYVGLVDRTEERAARFTFFFYTSRTIVTVGSLFVPALLSIQSPNSSSGEFTHQVYWSTWALSLLVSVFNALLTLFKIEKKFLYLHTDLERLNSEGWQYAELSGRYSGFYTQTQLPTHTNQFIFFCHMIEKIRIKEVEAEYSQASQDSPTKNQSQEKSSLGEMLSPTPLDPLKSGITLRKVFEESDEAPTSPTVVVSTQRDSKVE